MLKKSKPKVLLCESSSRQVLPMAKAFAALGYEVVTVQGKKTDLGAVTRYSSRRIVVNGVDDDYDTAYSFYKELLEKGEYELAVPLSDFSAGILVKLKKEIEEKTKTKIATNEETIFSLASDKLNTMKVCMENDIPCPPTFNEICSISDIPYGVSYPLLIKPRVSCGSIGLHIANNRVELERYIVNSRDEKNGEILVQEFIPQTGRQYNGHFFIDDNGDAKMALISQKCRWFPLDGGAATMCVTIHRQDITNMCLRLLNIIGWRGYCDIDLMEDPRDGSIRIIEINARISANIKLCFAAGIDVARMLVGLYLGNNVPNFLEYSDNICLRCIHTDFLWFVKSPQRFSSKPSWFKLKNTRDQIFSFSDPIPFVTFSFGALFKYKKEMKKRERE